MRPNFLQALQILTQFALHSICQYLRIFAINNISLSVEEPGWDFVLCRVLNNRDDSLEFFGCNFTGTVKLSELRTFGGKRGCRLLVPLVQVDIGFFADQVGVSAAHTLDLGQGIHDLLLAINIGVEETEDELDCTGVRDSEEGCYDIL